MPLPRIVPIPVRATPAAVGLSAADGPGRRRPPRKRAWGEDEGQVGLVAGEIEAGRNAGGAGLRHDVAVGEAQQGQDAAGPRLFGQRGGPARLQHRHVPDGQSLRGGVDQARAAWAGNPAWQQPSARTCRRSAFVLTTVSAGRDLAGSASGRGRGGRSSRGRSPWARSRGRRRQRSSCWNRACGPPPGRVAARRRPGASRAGRRRGRSGTADGSRPRRPTGRRWAR